MRFSRNTGSNMTNGMRGIERAFSPLWFFNLIPGALPQAGMGRAFGPPGTHCPLFNPRVRVSVKQRLCGAAGFRTMRPHRRIRSTLEVSGWFSMSSIAWVPGRKHRRCGFIPAWGNAPGPYGPQT